jgi:predicted ATPase/DNA-binding SARP family transcriptional activator
MIKDAPQPRLTAGPARETFSGLSAHGRGHGVAVQIATTPEQCPMSSPADSSPLASDHAVVVGSARLPVQLTSFVGRAREIARVREMLDATRLLTLTGAGGSGKTRLALEVATRSAARHRDGIAWIELAPLADPELLPRQVGAALGIREEGGRSAIDGLLDFLHPYHLLLVLDNCEHLADACAALADRLLRACPELTILATSREALGVAGERAWLVPALSLPDTDAGIRPEQVSGFEAVQLFIERAQDVLPSFSLTGGNAAAVAQICRRLDGLPLAIELAAARSKVLPPRQIAERLDDAFALLTSSSRTALARHRTLRATIDWSYELLTGPERRLLAFLSAFAGGFSLEAVEAVCAGDAVEAWDVLDLLTALVDKSLVVMEEHPATARYHLLETVRQYAASRLEESGDGPRMQRRHAEFFLALVEEAEPELASPRRHPWIERMRREHDNLRAALAWSAQAAGELNLRMAGALYWYWFHLGFWSEGRRWAEAALALHAGKDQEPARAKTLFAAGTLAFWAGDPAAGQPRLEASRDLWAALGEPRLEAHASLYHGMCTLALTRDPALARPAVEAAAAGFEAAGDRWGLTHACNALGGVLLLQQEIQGARDLYEKSAAIAHDLGDNLSLAIALQGVGEAARRQGDLAGAGEALREAIAVLRDEYDAMFMARTLEALASLAFDQGDAREAARFLGAAQSRRESVGAPIIELDRAVHRESVAAIRGKLGEEAFAVATAEGRRLSREQVTTLVLRKPVRAEPSTASAAGGTVHPPALRVLALGPLEIHRDGIRLPGDAFRYARPKELLLHLLVHPEGRTRDQIGLVFWPESSVAQVKNSFHVTMHHVRKALGRADWIILDDGRYRINPAFDVEFDAGSFERQATAVLREVRAGAGSADGLRAVLALYRGDFLQDEAAGDWHLELRGRLARLFIDVLVALGDLLVQAGDHAEAAAVYRRVVRREELHEEAHRGVIACLARTGDRVGALRHYEQLVALMREELGAEPSGETTALYARLQKAEPI